MQKGKYLGKAKEGWDAFEARVGQKRQGIKDHASATEITVQRMSTSPTTRTQKYMPLEPRVYVPFGNYEHLTLTNVKSACETHFCQPKGSCDVLASDKGPSCTKDEQIKKKKFFLIRFCCDESSMAKSSNMCMLPPPNKIMKPIYPSSVNISTLLAAGKLCKRSAKHHVKFELESFDIKKVGWMKHSPCSFSVDREHFATGGFRDAFKAHKVTSDGDHEMVVKKYKTNFEETLTQINLSVTDHARKQVQMHAVAKHVAEEFRKSVPEQFGYCFTYGDVYYALYEDTPVTVETFYDGDFVKYVNNDGTLQALADTDVLQEKAECLVHFSFEFTKHKMMLLDIQGTGYKLYDPEIATSVLKDNKDNCHLFCAGNLSHLAINKFILVHVCNMFCSMLKLKELELLPLSSELPSLQDKQHTDKENVSKN